MSITENGTKVPGGTLLASAAAIVSIVVAGLVGHSLAVGSLSATAITLTLPSHATGDLLADTGAGVYGRVADVATGQVFTSGGIGALPAWSGTPTLSGLTLALGSDVQGDVFFRSSGGGIARLAPGTTGQMFSSGGPGANPSWVTTSTMWPLAGGFTAILSGSVTDYYGIGGLPASTNFSSAALRMPVVGARTFSTLRIAPLANAVSSPTVFTVYQNGVATALTVSVPGSSTAIVTDITHTVAFADGDAWDLVATNTSGGSAAVLTWVGGVKVF